MKTWKILMTAAVAAAFAANAWAQQTTLRIFTGGQQRPDVLAQPPGRRPLRPEFPPS